MAPRTDGDAAADVDVDNQTTSPTMGSSVPTASPARPFLSIVALPEDTTEDLDVPVLQGDFMEISGPVLSLFQFQVGDRPVIIAIPVDLCSPAVRAKLHGLLLAVEREAIDRVVPIGGGMVTGLALLPNA